MQSKSKWLWLVFLTILIVQLSCSENDILGTRSNNRTRREDCENNGGIWHVFPWNYCEMSSVAKAPIKTKTSTASPTQTYDISQCDAATVVNVAPTLTEERFFPGSRWCSYSQITTNNSAQEIMFYYHDMRSTQDPDWVAVLLAPWESHEYLGYLQNTEDSGLIYAYMDKVAALFYNDECKSIIDYFDTPRTAELFDWEVTYFCSP